METKGFSQFEIIKNVLNHHKFSPFRFIWIPMLRVYIYNFFSAGIDFRRQNLTSKVVSHTERPDIGQRLQRCPSIKPTSFESIALTGMFLRKKPNTAIYLHFSWQCQRHTSGSTSPESLPNSRNNSRQGNLVRLDHTMCGFAPCAWRGKCGDSTTAEQTRDIGPILFRCWPAVYDVGPTSKQHRVNISCLLGVGKCRYNITDIGPTLWRCFSNDCQTDILSVGIASCGWRLLKEKKDRSCSIGPLLTSIGPPFSQRLPSTSRLLPATHLHRSVSRPHRDETLIRCWFNVGPASQTVNQH